MRPDAATPLPAAGPGAAPDTRGAGPLTLRYPDPAVEILHPSFAPLRLFSASVERLLTGLRWAEGPVWFGDGRFLLVSDIPNDRIVRWDETSGAASVFRQPSNHANGLARDDRGRLLACEHGTRRVTRTAHDGRIEVLADRGRQGDGGDDGGSAQGGGPRLNSPNDIVCRRSDGSVWFTDPAFGIQGWWEGTPAPSEQPPAVWRWTPDGRLQAVVTDLAAPNGLAFSPDERTLYVVDSRARPHRLIWAWDVDAAGTLSGRRRHIDAEGPGALDGIACDADGRLWCGWGSDGSPGAEAAAPDGVRVFDRDGRPIGHVHLPERCANLCFGGARRNRLFMAASHSVYALAVNVQGAG